MIKIWWSMCPRCGYRWIAYPQFLCRPCMKAVEETP